MISLEDWAKTTRSLLPRRSFQVRRKQWHHSSTFWWQRLCRQGFPLSCLRTQIAACNCWGGCVGWLPWWHRSWHRWWCVLASVCRGCLLSSRLSGRSGSCRWYSGHMSRSEVALNICNPWVVWSSVELLLMKTWGTGGQSQHCAITYSDWNVTLGHIRYLVINGRTFTSLAAINYFSQRNGSFTDYRVSQCSLSKYIYMHIFKFSYTIPNLDIG